MTKEEIIRKYEPYPGKSEVNIIGVMMDEYAKQIAINYGHFLLKKIAPNMEEIPNKEAEELFNKWFATQNNG